MADLRLHGIRGFWASLALLMSVGLLGADAWAGPTSVSGTISADTTWTVAGSPYIVTGTVYVYGTPTTPVTLTIQAGVEVRFNSATWLYVGWSGNKGTLNAEGTAASPVLFTSNQVTKTPGYWAAVSFEPGSAATSLLQYTTIEYGGYSAAYGSVNVNGSSPTLQNCTIQQSSSHGVSATGSGNPSLVSTTISGTGSSAAGIYVTSGSLSLSMVTINGTAGAYSISMPLTTVVTTAGTHSFDKPIELRSGEIQADTTWRNLGAPYVLNGTSYVYKDTTTASTLTVEAGVEVRFTSGAWLQVAWSGYKGTLNTQGTATSPVLFTSNQATKTPGDWGGVQFNAWSPGTSLLQYTTIEYGGAGASNGSIYVNGGSPTFQNCTVRNGNGNGIQVGFGSLSLTAMTFSSTGGSYSVSMPLTTSVTTAGTHSFDKPIELRSGVISADTTWRKLGAAYVLSGSSNVYNDTVTPSTLTVEAGVEVRFVSGAWLYVASAGYKGTLITQGTAASPVLFTSNQVTKTPGYWGGIQFDSGSAATSVLQYTTIEYGGSSPSSGSVYLNGGAPAFQNCTVRNGNGNGIQVSTGSLNLTSVTLSSTGGTYSISMPLTTSVTTAGTHSFDKPIELRYGVISADTTWKRLGAAYVLNGSSNVYKDTVTPSTLTVEAGVEVRFVSGAWLYVASGGYKGTLITQGTAASPVLFTSNQVTKTAGYWGGIQFDSGSAATSLLQYTTIEYGGSGGSGSVYANASSPTLQNCTVRYSSGDGVRAAGAAIPVLRANNFTNNTASAINNAGSGTIDARASWWGHASGPSGAGPGIGQRITGNAFYSPWLELVQDTSLFASSAQISPFLFDKTDGSTTVTASLSSTANWTLTIKDQSDTTVKTYTGAGAMVSQVWNGEETSGPPKVPDGLYTLRLTTAGPSMAPLVGKVRVTSNKAPVAIITSPASNAIVTGGVAVSIIGTASDVNDFVSYRLEYGVGATPSSWTPITPYPYDLTTPVAEGLLGLWTAPVGPTVLYTLRLTARDATNPPAVLTQPIRVMAIYNPVANPPNYFSPNGDGVSDTFTVTASLNLAADWTLTFKNASGATVRTFSGTGATAVSQVWDGKDSGGANVPDGAYTYTLSAVEPGSGVAANPFSGTINVDRVVPTALITAPTSSATVFDTITISGTAKDPTNFASYTVEYGDGAAPATWTSIVTSSTPVDSGTLATWITNSFIDEMLVPSGNGTKTIRLRVTDVAGNVGTAQVTVNLDDMLISSVSRTPTVIRPSSGETSTITFTTNQTATITVRILPETTPLKIYPDQTAETGAVRTFSLGSLPEGLQTVVWDGKDAGGTMVLEDAYMYVIQAQAPSGRFDKFNRYVQLQVSFSTSNGSIPPSEAACNAWTNRFFSHVFTVTGGPARGSTRLFDVATGGQVLDYRPQNQLVWTAGTNNTFFWDCRDANGSIVTIPVNMTWIGTHAPFRGLNSNYIVVQALPGLPGVSVESDPYRIELAYGQVAHIKYQLLDSANVTITVTDPGTGAQTIVLNDAAQAAGAQDVVWEGLAGDGRLVPTEGHYMFTITARNPAGGGTVVRRGNITVYR